MKKLIPLIVTVSLFLVGIYLYPVLPERMASHWGFEGEVNGQLDKFWGTFFLPLLLVFLYPLFIIIPKIDPKAKNIEKFRDHFDSFIAVLFLFLGYLYFLVLAWNLGFRFSIPSLLSPAFAFFFYFSGVLIQNTQPNWTIGIRTPWTLSNEKVWKKTHKLSSKLFKSASIIILLGYFFPNSAFIILFLTVITASLLSVVYSYIEYKNITS